MALAINPNSSLYQPKSPPGDVIFVLKEQPHPAFQRSGNDLLAKVRLTLSEALLGFSRIILTHLDGRGIEVTMPRGKIVRPEDTICLRGEGMPHYKYQDVKGDLFVTFDVEFPDEKWAMSVDHAVSCLTSLYCNDLNSYPLDTSSFRSRIHTGPLSAPAT